MWHGKSAFAFRWRVIKSDGATTGRREFRKNEMVDKKDFGAVEALLRMGLRKLELYSSPDVKDIH